MSSLEIRGERGIRVIIEIHGYENEYADNYYDANWLRCSVQLKTDKLRGENDTSFQTADFMRFLSELEQLVGFKASCATFQTLEDAFNLSIEIDKTGHTLVSGILREYPGSYNAISFRFESDQSFLAIVVTQLRKIVREFPEIQIDD